MDELITKAAVKQTFIQYKNDMKALTPFELNRLVDLFAMIKGLPAVDVAPVVRCRDCKNWGTPFDKNDTGFMVAHCEHFDESHAFSEQFYCASGERRDSE